MLRPGNGGWLRRENGDAMRMTLPPAVLRWWDQRAPRERRLLALMAVVLALALVVGAWWMPTLRQWRQLPLDIQASQERLENLQQLSQQAREWQSRGPAATVARLGPGTPWSDADRSRLLAPFAGCARAEPTPTGWNLLLQACAVDSLREGMAHLRSQTTAVPARARLRSDAAGAVEGSIEWQWDAS